MISAIILTKNEELDIPACLASLAWCDDIHVFDSFSTDRTVELAKAAGAAVTQRAFDNYAAQRNAAVHGLPFKHDWVLSLDADERVAPALVDEMRAFVRQAAPEVAAGRMRRRDYFQGRWLKHAQLSPYFVRLLRPARVRYEREVNETLTIDGRVHDLREPFDHFPFSKGVEHWIQRHNHYSGLEAQRALAERATGSEFSVTKALFARDFNERRLHQKGLFYRLPARPLVKLMYVLILRRAFLDGWPGIHYAFLQASYEHFIILKEQELRPRR